jgi:hypothetical protein
MLGVSVAVERQTAADARRAAASHARISHPATDNRPEPTLSERIVAALSSEDYVVLVALRLPAHECPGVNFYLLRIPPFHESRDRCVRCHVTTRAKYRCAPYSIGGSKEFNGRAPILPAHRQIHEESAETYQKQQITYQSKQIWLQPYQSSMPGR